MAGMILMMLGAVILVSDKEINFHVNGSLQFVAGVIVFCIGAILLERSEP